MTPWIDFLFGETFIFLEHPNGDALDCFMEYKYSSTLNKLKKMKSNLVFTGVINFLSRSWKQCSQQHRNYISIYEEYEFN